MKTKLIVILAALALSGCSTIDLSNRASRTLACDKVLVTSMWQWFGISTEIDKRDAAALLRDCKAEQAATK